MATWEGPWTAADCIKKDMALSRSPSSQQARPARMQCRATSQSATPKPPAAASAFALSSSLRAPWSPKWL
jgi:hypothetical protein